MEAASQTAQLPDRGLGSLDVRRILPFAGLLALIAVGAYFAVESPLFLRWSNISNIIVQGAVVAIAAYGLTLVLIVGGGNIVTGGIDVSVGAVTGLSASLIAVCVAAGWPLGLAVLAGLGCAAAIGAINAIGAVIGLSALIVTLATMNIAAGVDTLLTDEAAVRLDHPVIEWIASSEVAGVPVIAAILALVTLLFYLAVHKTRIGLRAHAVGGNRISAHLAGIPIKRYVACAYLACALTAGLAGLLLVARIHGSSPGAGSILLLDIALASFISAIFSRHLVPNIPGTLLGAMFGALLTNGFTLTNVPTYWVTTVKGAVVLLVVGVAALASRQKDR